MTEVVHDQDGHAATVEAVTDEAVRIRLPNGVAVRLSRDLVSGGAGGSFQADLRFADLGTTVLQEVEERVDVRTEQHETGRVVARTVTETAEAPVEASGWREAVEVERVPVGRVVDAVEGPRDEEGVTVIPVYEERLVVSKELVLREEVRLVRRRESVPGPDAVEIRRQRVEVERLPPGDAT